VPHPDVAGGRSIRTEAGHGEIDWVDREGAVSTPLENVHARWARVAPDGNRVAVKNQRRLLDFRYGTRYTFFGQYPIRVERRLV